MPNTGSLQFCKDLEAQLVNVVEFHTPQSNLCDRTYTISAKVAKGDASARIGLAQEDDDPNLVEACFKAQGLTVPHANSKAKITQSKKLQPRNLGNMLKCFEKPKQQKSKPG